MTFRALSKKGSTTTSNSENENIFDSLNICAQSHNHKSSEANKEKCTGPVQAIKQKKKKRKLYSEE